MNKPHLSIFVVFVFAFFLSVSDASAATLKVSPSTGVYTVGKAFTVSVLLSTEGKAVNAADGILSFNPRELQVIGASRASSIFNLWTEEPTYSNAAGTVSFGGGSPTGYKGTTGGIITITFKPLGAGTPKVNFKSGSILAADGLGTNVLTGMTGASFTIAAASESPAPEYIAPANAPKAPVVTSGSHPEQGAWYKEKTATLSWVVPNDVTALRTLLDSNEGSVPTNVYEELITQKSIDDLDEGVSYFHIQFKNKDGWGKIAHYRLGVDSEAPKNFTITQATSSDPTAPGTVLKFSFEDVSPVLTYKIQIDGAEPLTYTDEKQTKMYVTEPLTPGYHTLIIEAEDSAGNSTGATISFTVEAIEKPRFFEFPTRINTDVIPAIKGKTVPHARVAVEVKRAADGSYIQTVEGSDGVDPYSIVSDENGEFIYVPDTAFERGVYILSAKARDESGRLSEKSDEIKIIVEAPGYVVIGTMVVNALSVIIPLFALVLLLIFGSWYLWHRLSSWRRRVRKETIEAEDSLTVSFNTIIKNLNEKVAVLKDSRKGKLTKAESELISQIEDDLRSARSKISKEIVDIEDTLM